MQQYQVLISIALKNVMQTTITMENHEIRVRHLN